MSLFSKTLILALGILVLGTFSCIKKKEYPINPDIEFKEFQNFSDDSAYFTFRFTDGDGDFGLNPEDTTGAYSSSSVHYYNLYMKYMYKKTDGSWSGFFNPNPLVNDTQYYKFRVPFVEQTGKDKSMNGEVRVKLSELRPTSSHKNIKYVFYIYDKALHQSNVETTPEFTLP
jgi:hypothetical protein